MAKLSLTRRSFIKATAIAAAAAGLSSNSVTSTALAEGVDETAGEVTRIRSCCRACGKVECGVWVTVQDNKVIRVEGDEATAHGRGHCCSKSQSSMLALYHPDRLRYCLKRTNPKGEDDAGWVRITLAEAFDEAGAKFNEVVEKYGGDACFAMGGTSRVWAQPPYGTLKSIFPTTNAHLAYEICKGPRHFGGQMTDEIGSPWMEVEQGPLVYLQWGTASEYSNYDSNNRTVVDCSQRAYKHILVDPRMTPLGKEADVWLPLRVGTDLCMSLGWNKWIVDNEAYDDLFVRRWTNAPFLWNPEKDGRTYKGWFMEMSGGIELTSRLITEADCDPDWVNKYWKYEGRYMRFIVWDEANNKPTYWDAEECQWEGEKHKIPTTGTWVEHPYKPIVADAWLPDPSHFADPADKSYDKYWNEGNEKGKKSNPKGLPKVPALFVGDGAKIKLKSGKTISAGTVWEEWCHNLEPYTLDYVAEVTEVPAEKIEEAVKIYTTRLNPLHGNGGIHYQLAPDQVGHAVQNTRSLQIIACITGNSDEPAGNRGSCKAQVDGCCGRANMLISDYSASNPELFKERTSWWGVKRGTMELGNTPRNLTIEQQIPLIQKFVQYLIDEKSPLAERYGNKVPTDDEARWIAERKGGNYRTNKAWPNPMTGFDRLEKQISAERFPLLRYWNRWADSATIWDSINEINTPYQIHAEVCMSGDFMNESNLLEAWEAQCRLDFYLDVNLWACPNNGCADIIIPTLHWLEVNTGRVSQGAGGLFGAGQRCVEPMGDCIYDPVAVICLYKAMGVTWNNRDPEYDEWNNLDYNNFVQMGGNVTYEEQEYRVLQDATDAWKIQEMRDIDDHVKRDPKADIKKLGEDGWLTRAEKWMEIPEIYKTGKNCGPDWPRYAAKFQKEGWFDERKWHPERWGTYRRWEMGYRRQQGGYNLYAAVDEKCAFFTTSGKVEIWATPAESYIGDDVPKFDELHWDDRMHKTWDGVETAVHGTIPDPDKFPHWVEPKNSRIANPEWFDPELVDQIKDNAAYITDNWKGDDLLNEYRELLVKYGKDHTFIATSGSRQPVYFHSEHRQLPWCRELWPSPRTELNPNDAAKIGVEQGDWIWCRTPWGAVREVADLYYGIKEGTVNNNHGWWYPEFDTASHGFELVNINCTMDKYAQCDICGASQLRGNPMLVYKATPENCPKDKNGKAHVVPALWDGTEAISNADDERLKQWLSNDPRLDDSAIELTYASKDAWGLQHSIQDPEYYQKGTLPKGERGNDTLGQYKKTDALGTRTGSYKN